jgi:hypothetical protein
MVLDSGFWVLVLSFESGGAPGRRKCKTRQQSGGASASASEDGCEELRRNKQASNATGVERKANASTQARGTAHLHQY